MRIRMVLDGGGDPKKFYMIVRYNTKTRRWQYIHGSSVSLHQANECANLFDGVVVRVSEFNAMSAAGWI